MRHYRYEIIEVGTDTKWRGQVGRCEPKDFAGWLRGWLIAEYMADSIAIMQISQYWHVAEANAPRIGKMKFSAVFNAE